MLPKERCQVTRNFIREFTTVNSAIVLSQVTGLQLMFSLLILPRRFQKKMFSQILYLYIHVTVKPQSPGKPKFKT